MSRQPKICGVMIERIRCNKVVHKAGRCIDHYIEWQKIKRVRDFRAASNVARQEKNHIKAQLRHPSGRQLKKLRRFEKQRAKEIRDASANGSGLPNDNVSRG